MNAALSFLYHLWIDQPNRWHPLLSVYYLTYSCRFRCPYCSDGAGKPYYQLPQTVLSAEKVVAVLQRIRQAADYLVLTGGEPLEHPEFREVIQSLKHLKFKGVILTTNGYEADTYLSEINQNISSLVFSLDTLDQAKADQWHGRSGGTAARIMANLERAAAYPGRRYEVVISSVVTPENIADLFAVYEFARKHGFKFAACPQLVGVKAHHALIANNQYRAFYDLLIAEKQRGANIHGTVGYLEHMRDLRKFACRPFTMLVVSPTGDVFYPCLELGKFAGNILEEPNLHRLRQKGREQLGPQPDCDTRCHSACALGFALLLRHPCSIIQEAWFWARGRIRR